MVGAVVVGVVLVGPPAAPQAQERVVVAAKGVVQSTVSGTGNLAPATQLDVSFQTGGTVTGVYVKEGERVAEGQVLARLDDRSAKVQLAQAQAAYQEALDAAEAANASSSASSSSASAASSGAGATANASTAPGGSAAVAGKLSFVSVSAAQADDDAASEPTPTTPQQAPSQETTTPQEAPEGTSTAPQTTTTPDRGAGQGTSTAPAQAPGGSGGGGSTGSGSAPGGSDGGGSSLSPAAAAANLESARLAVEEAEQAVAATVLRAPVSGTIAEISGAVGDTVSAGSSSAGAGGGEDSGADSGAAAGAGGVGGTSGGSSGTGDSSGSGFLTLATLDDLELEVSFSESDIGKLKVGQAATVSVTALAGVELAARVTSIASLPDTSGSVVEYPVTLSLRQQDDQLKAGMTASAEVVVSQVDGAVNVPSAAIGPGSTVTVRKNGEDETQRVSTGLVGEATTEVVSGLEQGDEVVIAASEPTAGAAGGQGAFPGGGGGLGGGGLRGGGLGGGGLGGGPPGGGPPGVGP